MQARQVSSSGRLAVRMPLTLAENEKPSPLTTLLKEMRSVHDQRRAESQKLRDRLGGIRDRFDALAARTSRELASGLADANAEKRAALADSAQFSAGIVRELQLRAQMDPDQLLLEDRDGDVDGDADGDADSDAGGGARTAGLPRQRA
jgi:hypothetical protein